MTHVYHLEQDLQAAWERFMLALLPAEAHQARTTGLTDEHILELYGPTVDEDVFWDHMMVNLAAYRALPGSLAMLQQVFTNMDGNLLIVPEYYDDIKNNIDDDNVAEFLNRTHWLATTEPTALELEVAIYMINMFFFLHEFVIECEVVPNYADDLLIANDLWWHIIHAAKVGDVTAINALQFHREPGIMAE